VFDVDSSEFVVVLDRIDLAVRDEIGLLVLIHEDLRKEVEHPTSRTGFSFSEVPSFERIDQFRVERIRLLHLLTEPVRHIDVVSLVIGLDVLVDERLHCSHIDGVGFDQTVAEDVFDIHLVGHVHLDSGLS